VPDAGPRASEPAKTHSAVPTAVTWLVLLLCVVLVGCSRTVEGAPQAAARGAARTGAIQPAQLVELLTPSFSLAVTPGFPLVEHDMQSALFVGADPVACQGVVGYGRYPLFPTNYNGREARTQMDSLPDQHQLLEVSATYPGDFNASRFLDSVRRTVSGCQSAVTAWGDDQFRYTVNPRPLIPGSPEVVHWMTNLAGHQWICEFGMIAKSNVVSQIVTCSADRSVDIEALITERLKKIEELLNFTL
jgi:hypothetical protein